MLLKNTLRILFLLTILCPLLPGASIVYISASGSPVSYLTGLGHTVAYLENPTGLTLASLSSYDVAIAVSNSIFSEPANIGNVLGQFANSGKGVVLTEFVFQGEWALGGTIMGAGYSPFSIDPLSTGYNVSGGLGTIYDPGNPMFSGLTTANLQTSFQAQVGVNPGATLVADWASGRHAIAYRSLASSSIVALNLFPQDSYVNADTQRLVSNAVNYSMGVGGDPAPVPEPATMLIVGAGLLILGLIRFRS
jgi:hypothetical protein